MEQSEIPIGDIIVTFLKMTYYYKTTLSSVFAFNDEFIACDNDIDRILLIANAKLLGVRYIMR